MNGRITFRSICEADLDYRMRWLNDDNLRVSIGFDGENSVEANREWLSHCQGKDRDFSMILCDGVPIGILGLKNISKDNKDAEAFIMIGSDEHRGQGIGEISMKYLISLAAKLGLKRLYLTVNESNVPAIKMYKKIDFGEAEIKNNEILMVKKL